MAREIGVSYYGVRYLDKCILDFHEMLECGINAILFAVSEFDAWFWYNNIIKTIEKSKEMGFITYIDFWGWGKVFGGEPPSIFLQNHTEYRQISALTGKKLPAACFNCEEFRNYIIEKVESFARESDVDYFFWNEPHYYTLSGNDWSCYCETCRKLFKEEYGYEMPRELTKDVIEFRQKCIINFLREISDTVKKVDSKKKVTVCLLPTFDVKIGIPNWERVAEINSIDMLATDPYWIGRKSFEEGIKWFENMVDNLIDLAKKYDKLTQVWVQAFKVPSGREWEVVKGIELAASKNVYSIFVWCYRAGMDSILASGNVAKLWSLICEAFRKIQKT